MHNNPSNKTDKLNLTPSTLKLTEMRKGKGPGMLTMEEIELLRKSKKEISEACQNHMKLLNSSS
jgi:hypothetical protein